MMMTDMLCLNNGEATRNSRQEDGLDTAPDITFVHSARMEKYKWEILDELGADHKPILITYEDDMEIPVVNTKPKYKWKLSKADWAK